MNSAAGAPGGIDRRAFRGLSLVPQSLPAKALKSAIDDAVAVRLVQDVFIECGSREQFVSLLDRQVAISEQVKRPIVLVLVEVIRVRSVRQRINAASPIYDEAVLNVVAKIFKANLRPGDFIFRPSCKTLGIVLLDAEASGAGMVCIRLHDAISRRISFGKGSVEICVKFAVSEQVTGKSTAGETLLSTAESALEKAKQSDATFIIAGAVGTLETGHN